VSHLSTRLEKKKIEYEITQQKLNRLQSILNKTKRKKEIRLEPKKIEEAKPSTLN